MSSQEYRKANPGEITCEQCEYCFLFFWPIEGTRLRCCFSERDYPIDKGMTCRHATKKSSGKTKE